MIVQTTLTRDECFLLKEMLPLWKKYADGFIFMVDKCTTDETREFLKSKKEEYNILDIIEHEWNFSNPSDVETDGRQKLFDKAYSYTNKIISLDTDEYLDGPGTKDQLENILDKNPDTVGLLHWVQYVNSTEARVDSVWRDAYHDRVGCYTYNAQFEKVFNHSSHLPKDKASGRVKIAHIDPNQLFIAHIQWLDKTWVGIKQYYWKVWDYVKHKEYGAPIINYREYDVSVNNFRWQHEVAKTPLKIDANIYAKQDLAKNYKLNYIIEQTIKHDIPNLGDWGLGIFDLAMKHKIK